MLMKIIMLFVNFTKYFFSAYPLLLLKVYSTYKGKNIIYDIILNQDFWNTHLLTNLRELKGVSFPSWTTII